MEPLGAVSHVTVLLGAVRLLASVLHAASFRAKAGCHFGLRACCLALFLVLQRRYSTRKYRASLSRIGLPPLHQLASERVQHPLQLRRQREAIRASSALLHLHAVDALLQRANAAHCCSCAVAA